MSVKARVKFGERGGVRLLAGPIVGRVYEAKEHGDEQPEQNVVHGGGGNHELAKVGVDLADWWGGGGG